MYRGVQWTCAGGAATDVVPPEGQMQHQNCLHCVHTATVDGEEPQIVHIYCINENNFYGCSHVQLDIGEGKL
jgi:hypothetical protein